MLVVEAVCWCGVGCGCCGLPPPPAVGLVVVFGAASGGSVEGCWWIVEGVEGVRSAIFSWEVIIELWKNTQ